MKLSEFDKTFYKNNITLLAGIDEAGRGPLAGPVVAAVVIFPKEFNLDSIRDSKKISEKKRLQLFDEIISNAIDYGIGICHEDEIDEINILKSTFKAMKKALGNLKIKPDLTLIDGLKGNIKLYNCKYIVKGDNKSQSIAAASILAKVARDKLMVSYDKIYPEFGFAKHKGYGTKFHLDAIRTHKSSPIHRRSFRPVLDYLPSFSFYNTNLKLQRLATQIVATLYLKNNYKIIEIFKNNNIDIFHFEENRKVLSIVKFNLNNSLIINYQDFNNKKNRNEIKLKEKELKQNIHLDVIIEEFSKKKPKIIIEKNVYKK